MGEAAARRELEEETGYQTGKISKVWEGFASPGYSNEVIKFYLAEKLKKAEQKADEDEFIEVDLIDLPAAVRMLKDGKIKDNKTMIGILIADLHLKGELK